MLNKTRSDILTEMHFGQKITFRDAKIISRTFETPLKNQRTFSSRLGLLYADAKKKLEMTNLASSVSDSYIPQFQSQNTGISS